MNTLEAALFTGIPHELLIRMRTRTTTTLRSGPPFSKVISKKGLTKYVYNKKALTMWMKNKSILLTAGEAAYLLGISREETINVQGVLKVPVSDEYSIVLYPSRNIFIFLRKAGVKYA